MTCLLCTLSEKQFDLNRGQRIPAKHPQDVTGIICSNCIQVLIATRQDKFKKAYQVASDKGIPDKAKVLESFIEEEFIENGEAKKPKRNLIREGPLRMVRPTANEIRPQQAVV